MDAPMDAAQIPPPPRIKAWPWNGKRISGQWHVAGLGETTEYVRADLFNAQAAELERLRDALEYIMDGYGLNPPEFKQEEYDEDGERIADDWIVTAIRAALKGSTQ